MHLDYEKRDLLGINIAIDSFKKELKKCRIRRIFDSTIIMMFCITQ